MYLVIDTCVWEKARSGDPYALALLTIIQIRCEHEIICDYEGEILEEYKKHIRDIPLTRLFVMMTQTGKIKPRPKIKIKIEGFDKSDLKFIQVAISSSALIVSEDSDFFAIQRTLREKGLNVEVLSPKETFSRLQ